MSDREEYMDVKISDMDLMFQQKAITNRVLSENSKYTIAVEKERDEWRRKSEKMQSLIINYHKEMSSPTEIRGHVKYCNCKLCQLIEELQKIKEEK